jgi:hypothetical protein
MVRIAGLGMSRLSELESMARLYQEAAGLDREALELLRNQAPLGSLKAIFARKEALGAELEALKKGMERHRGPREAEDGIALARALEAQRTAAHLEQRLAEALGNAVPRSGKFSAYEKSSQSRAENRLNQSI